MHVAAPAMRRLIAVTLAALCALAAPVAAAPAVVLSNGGAIEAPGAMLGMDVRPGGEAVLVGEDGWAHRIDGLQLIEGTSTWRWEPVEAWTSTRSTGIRVAPPLLVGDTGLLFTWATPTPLVTPTDRTCSPAGTSSTWPGGPAQTWPTSPQRTVASSFAEDRPCDVGRS